MNGVLPMMSPVTGSRSGAPGGRVSSSTTTTSTPRKRERGVLQPARLVPAAIVGVGRSAATVDRPPGVHGPRRGSIDPLGETAATIARTISEAIAKNSSTTIVIGAPPVERDGLVGDLGEHRVDRRGSGC